jgi:NADH-quinone oxidoreductase subunit H
MDNTISTFKFIVWIFDIVAGQFSPSIFLFYLDVVREGLSVIVPLLIGVAFFTVTERQLMSAVQRRIGPNVVGFSGLFQALADGLKLLVKETVIPSNGNPILFIAAPLLSFGLALLGWAAMPISSHGALVNIDLGLLYLFAVSSLAVYGVIIAGWSSNSKYAFLGALRSAAQMISYEVSIGFIRVCLIRCSGSLNRSAIVESQLNCWYLLPLLPIAILFFVSVLAETNRHPFDLPEAEAELVSGYNVEYSAIGFALFFLGEYANILLMSTLTALLFLGGWLAPFALGSSAIWTGIKTRFFAIIFIVARVAYPRYRYDQLIRLGWKVFLPVSLGWLLGTAVILYSISGLVGRA